MSNFDDVMAERWKALLKKYFPGRYDIMMGAETEQPEKRPSCGYKVKLPEGGRVPCGSEDKLWEVKGKGSWGKELKTPVCEKHVTDAWKNWNVDSMTPDCTGKK